MLEELMQHFSQNGRIEWIGIRPEKKGAVVEKEQVEVSVDNGIAGDHYAGQSGERHVTLIQAEHLKAIASFLSKEEIDPAALRRNLVISGINLAALKGKSFRIGNSVTLEYTGICHPCSRMEENLGVGGYNATRGHSGITARVIKGGSISIGDQVSPH